MLDLILWLIFEFIFLGKFTYLIDLTLSILTIEHMQAFAYLDCWPRIRLILMAIIEFKYYAIIFNSLDKVGISLY